MFHRVKSELAELESEAKKQEKATTQDAEKAAVGSEASAPQPTQTSEPTPQPQTPEKKEATTMTKSAAQTTDTNNETKVGQSKAGEYAAPAGYRASAAPARPGYAGGAYPSYASAQAAQKKDEQDVSAPAEEKAAVAQKTAEDSRLLIGRGITMSGEIEYCDTLVVEGTVEAALKGARSLEIAESGVFYGAVNIDEATVSGRFEGDITVNGRLSITSTGTVTGSIAYGSLDVESGAVIEGKISAVKAQSDQQRQEKTQAARGASAMARGGQVDTDQEAANTQGGELFSHSS